MRLSLIVLILACAFAAGTAHAAAGRVAIVPFTGPRASVPRDQIVKALCGELTCVPQATVTRRGKPDWRKVRRAGVEVVFTGAVSGPASRRVLTLDGFDARGQRILRERVRLARNGRISRRDLQALTGNLFARFEPREKVTPPPRAPERPVVQPEPEPERPEVAKPRVEEVAPLLLVEAGADFIYRQFAYSDLRVANLRAYETRPVMFAPTLRAEFHPLTLVDAGIWQGLGLEAAGAFVLGLRSIDENDRVYPTSVTRFDLAARFDYRPGDGLDLVVTPLVGFRNAAFSVGAASDGTTLAGMPAIRYIALRVGAAAELGLRPLVVFGRFEYLPVSSLGEIGSEAFFPDGGASAFEVKAGTGYEVVERLQLRLGLHYTRYGLWFRPAAGATYDASGATDHYLGGAVTARYTFGP